MAFCPNCGKELNDGEVCLCKTTASEVNEAIEENVTNQASTASVSTPNVDVKKLANGILGLAKEIVAEPKEGTKKFVNGISWLNIGIIAALYAVINVIFNIISMIKANLELRKTIKETAKAWGIDFDEYVKNFDIDTSVYGFGDFIKGIFMEILQVAAGIAISAVVFYFAVKLIKKINITWKTAFAIAVIELLIYVPLTVLYEVLGWIPSFKLLTWIMSAVISVRTFGSTMLTYFGLESVCEDTKSTLRVAVPAWALCSIGTSLVYFLLTSLLN